MADLTADEINRLKQAFLVNDKDGSVVEKLKQIINAASAACYGVTYTISAEGVPGADKITVSCQFTDLDGDDMAYRVGVMQWLSTDATGEVLEAAATSFVAGTDGGVIEAVSDGLWMGVSEADGDLDLVIENAGGADTLYLNTQLPNGKIVTSSAIVFA